MRILLAGSNGFLGRILSSFLVPIGYEVFCVDRSVDLSKSNDSYISCDLSKVDLDSIISKEINFDIIIDLAAEIDFAVVDQKSLYNNNIACVKNLLNFAKSRGVKKYIYTSSNSVYLGARPGLITDADLESPTDEYGRSKLNSENILLEHSRTLDINIIRCPNIIDAGRIGMLGVLFELLESNSTLWLVGDGNIRHQCIYAQDLCTAIERLIHFDGSCKINIGSDDVPTFRFMFSQLAEYVGSKSRVRSIPVSIVIPIMRLLYLLKLSPMGPYQFRMLTRDFIFDTSVVRSKLKWSPTKNNIEMLKLAYDFYVRNKNNIDLNNSANSKPVKMGVLKLLKYIKF